MCCMYISNDYCTEINFVGHNVTNYNKFAKVSPANIFHNIIKILMEMCFLFHNANVEVAIQCAC